MTQLYSNRLVLLIVVFFFQIAANATIGRWVSVSSESPVSPKISSSGNISTFLNVNVNLAGFYLEEKTIAGLKYQIPHFENGHPIMDQGSPDLPKLTFSIQLPASGNSEVYITSSQFIDFPDVNIPPSIGNISRNVEPTVAYMGEVNKTNSFYPGKLVSSDKPFIVRNTRAGAFQVYPLQYNPVTHMLRVYYQIECTISISNELGDNPLRPEDNNIASVQGFELPILNNTEISTKSKPLPSEVGSMLVICPKEFTSAIMPLVEWRRMTGTTVDVIDAAQFSGPEELYAFVKDQYTKKGNLAYLLLVGDAAQVPTYIFPYGSSDNYYSFLSGDDHYPDIFVGRFSAEFVRQVEVQVKRTIEYEKGQSSDLQWIANATGIGSTLTPGDDGESDYQHIRNLLKVLKSTTYKSINEFYDGSQGESDAAGNPTIASINNKLNLGTGVVFYTGHASSNSWGTGDVTVASVNSLTNQGKYPIIFSAACDNGNFVAQTCLAEAWMRASDINGNPAGAVAVHMGSGAQTNFPPMEAQDKEAELLARPVEGVQTIGALVVSGMMSMNDVYGDAGYSMTDTYILFGDPALKIRTAVPIQLTASHNKTIGQGRTIFRLSVNASSANACLSQNGAILGTASIINKSGVIYLDKPVTGKSIDLVVTSMNYLPYKQSIEVMYKPGEIEQINPADHSKLQPLNRSFYWNDYEGGESDYYIFYLGTDNPPTNMVNGQKIYENQFIPQFEFAYNTTYYWKVVSVNKYGNSNGEIHDFSTIFVPDEDFEGGIKSKLNWKSSGSQPWYIDDSQYFDGEKAIRSGNIDKGEISSLLYDCQVSGCEFVSFWSKTMVDSVDKLQFLIDGIVINDWQGETQWGLKSYKIEEGLHQLEWKYIKNSKGTSAEQAVWIDDVHLPIHALKVQSMDSASICAGSVFETPTNAENYFSAWWTTNGDGDFEDINSLITRYITGPEDIKNGKTTLNLNIHGYEGCPEVEKSIELFITPLPIITLPNDTIVNPGKEIRLDATIPGILDYIWSHNGSILPVTSVVLDADDAIQRTSITVTNLQGCSVTKTITIHNMNGLNKDMFTIFPNPNNGVFSISPLSGTSKVSSLKLINSNGQIVWQQNEEHTIIGSEQLPVFRLASGKYLLVVRSDKGHSVNSVVIRKRY